MSTKNDSDRRRLVIGVEGMTCSSCTSTVTRALEQLPSVKNVVVSLSTNSAVLEYNSMELKATDIIKEIEDNGFDGKILQESSVPSEQKTFKKLTIGIEGMTCASCTSTVDSALKSLQSVRAVAVSLATNSATLEYDPSKISSRQIIEEVEANGFDGKVMNETDVSAGAMRASSISANSSLRKLTLGVDGMTCSSCTSTVESALSSMKGVEEVVVSLSTNSASLLYYPNDVTPAAIIEEIESIGFEGKVLNEEAAGSSEEQYQSGTNSIEAPKSLLLTVTTSNVTSNELEEYVTRLASLAGVISASITDKEDQQITVHFHEKFTGPRKFYALAKQCHLMITISSMGSFLMATRLLQLQQREMKEQQYLLSFAIILSIPIVFLGMILPLIPNQHFTEIMILPGLSCSSFLQFILATPIQFYIGHRFNKKALMSFKTKTFGMDFMISTGTIASYVYSVITLIKSMANPSSMNSSNMNMSGSMPSEGGGMEDTYFDTTAVLITAVLFGKYLEIYAKGRTTEAIHKLSSLRAKTARLVGSMPEDHMLTAPSHYSSIPEDELNAVNEGNEIVTDEAIMDASLLHKYDVIRLVVGEVIPADGVLLSGSNVAVNESLLTGESQLIPKKEFDFIHGGATVVEGSALLRVMNVGDETTLGKIIQTVQEAQISKPKIQEIADKIASYFVPTVMMISAITFFVWIILAAAGFVPSMWYVEISGGGGPFLLAFTFALSVWVSACPCAFGLATPTAVLVATGVAAKYGILIRKGAALQTASEIDTICFDKTGTLTKGCTEVTDCYYIDQDEQLHALPYYDEVSNEEETNTTSPSMGDDPNRRDNTNLEKRRQQQDQSVLQYFLSLFTNNTNHSKGKHQIDFYEEVFHCLSLLLLAEKRSNHPLAKGITQYCQHLLFALEQPSLLMKLGVNRSATKSSPASSSSSLPTEEELLFDIIPGQGVCMYTNPSSSSSSSSASSLSNVQVLVGNIHLLKSKGIVIPRYIEEISNGFTAGGKVSIYFGINGRLAGILSLADKVRSETVSVLRQLQKSRKIDCYMVTGDQQSTAIAIGSSIGIETSHILAGVKPEEKELFIAALQAKGRKVAFVGDGTNDGPALARANVGIAMASGSEIAIEAGDLLLCNNHLQTLITTLDLSSFTLWRIKMNYLWAFGYNVCLIPLAAGVLYPFFHFALQPMYAGAVMALSSVSIVFSSLTITLFTPKTGNKTKDSWWWFLRNAFPFFPSTTSMKQTQSQKTEKKSYDQLNRSENDIEMTEQQHTHSDQSSNCHCPVSTVSQSEDDYDDSSTGLLPRSFSDIIAETPNRIRKITRTISKNVYRKVNSTEEDLEEAEDEENHRRGKYGGSGYTARMILEDYRQQLELDQPTPVNGDDGFVLPLSTMNPLMKQRGQSKKSDLITDVAGTMDAVNGLEKAMGCGCGGDNCRCYGQCKCGLRKRT